MPPEPLKRALTAVKLVARAVDSVELLRLRVPSALDVIPMLASEL